MKKSLKLFALIFSSSLVLAGCDDFEPNWPMEAPNIEDLVIDTPWTDYAVPVTSIALGKGESNLELKKGDTYTFSYTAEPRDAFLSNLVWESSDPSVATIENGVLTALAGGQTNISVSCGEVSAKSKVNVVVPIEDFEVKNKALDLDIEGEAQIEVDFSPIDTTQNKIKYELVEPGKVTVSDSGLVKALKNEGDTEIRVTNEALNKVETVTVHVSDKWNYISEFTLSGPTSIEVSKSGQVEASVIGTDPSLPATTLRENVVTYSVKEGSENKISVDAETGEFTALDVGNATIIASIFDGRATEDKDPETAEFTVNIFEVSATAISLGSDSHTTIELNNKDADKATYQLSYSYVIEDAYKDDYDVPSRGKPAFSSDDKDVATVSEDGLITFVGASKNPDAVDPFETKIRITDPSYTYYDSLLDKNLPISDYVTVHNTVYAESISIVGDDTFYLDETITLTAETNPKKVSENVIWEYDDSTGHTFVEDGNQLKITCNNLNQKSIEVTAKIGSNLQDSIELHPIERPVPFEDGKVYIVGSANYKTGTSKPVEGGSWTEGKYAFIMSDPIGDDTYALYKFRATITFNKDDEWKIRENVEDWRTPEEDTDGEYENSGALASGQMSVTGEGAEKKIVVNTAGKYDIYYTKYSDYYKVYVEEHGLKLDVNEVHAKLTSPAAATTILASNWDGTLSTKDVDDTYIDVELNGSTGAISITPKALGETTFKVFDDLKEIEVHVLITKESTADKTSYYIRGTAVNGWDEVSEDFVLRESSDDNNIGEILDVYLKDGEFKIAGSDWNNGSWGYWYKNNDEENDHMTVQGGAAEHFSEANGGSGNIKCNVAGYYNIFLTKNNYIYIEYASTPLLSLELSAEEASIELDETFTVTASGLNGEFQVVATPTIADVAITGNSALITPKATGTETIKFTDSESGDICDFELTVNAISAKTHKFIQTKSWINNGGEGQHVYVYAFKMDSNPLKENAPFPGEEATWLRDLDDGMKLFETRFKDIYDTIIVSRVDDNDPNGTRQTDNVDVSVLTDNCIYFNGESLPDGYLTVGTFPYGTFGLSADEGTITSGHSTTVNFINTAYEVTYTVSPEDSAEVTIVGDTATITSSTEGDSTITFTDGTHGNATYDLHVDAPVSTNRQYIETKQWFNSGASNEDVYVYAFKEGSDPKLENATFPGEEATWLRDIEDGKKIFYFDIPTTYDTFIVSKLVDGVTIYQTADISISSLEGDDCVYLNADSGSSSIPVGHYPYTLTLSENSGTITAGGSTIITLERIIGTVTYEVTTGTASVTISGDTAIIESSTTGDHTITFTDTFATGTHTATYSLHVNEAVATNRQYIETKSWFNSGAANEEVFVYCFKDGQAGVENAAFPGEEATWVKDIEDGKKIFYFDIPDTYDTFIVSKVVDGVKVYQTADISISSLEGDNCVYLNAESGSSSIPVGHYNYVPA